MGCSKILHSAYFKRLQTIITDHQSGKILIAAYSASNHNGNIYTLIYAARGNKTEPYELALCTQSPAENGMDTGLRYPEDSLMHSRQITGATCVPGIRLLRILALALLFGPGGASADDASIEIGIIPTLSTRTILATYQPLREYLQEQIKQPVVLVTAPDYQTFIERTQRGEYRYVVTAPHFARLAQAEAGYVPMVRVQRELRGIVVVRAVSNIKTINDLRGKIVSTPENIAVVTMLGLQLLREHGLVPGRKVTVRAYASFNSAVLAVQNGESDAAFTAQTALNQMPEETRSALRTIASTKVVPHVIYLASKQVPPKEVERMTRLLLSFSEDKPRGASFFKQTGFLGYVRPTAAELRNLDPYVTELKHQLATPNR